MSELIVRLTALFDKIDRFSDVKLAPLYNEAVAAMQQQCAFDMFCVTVFTGLLFGLGWFILVPVNKSTPKDKTDENAQMLAFIIGGVIILIAVCMLAVCVFKAQVWYQAVHYPSVTLLKSLKHL